MSRSWGRSHPRPDLRGAVNRSPTGARLTFVTLARHGASTICCRRAGPLWAGRCRRENGLAVLPPGKSGGSFFMAGRSSPRSRFAISSSTARSAGVRLSSPSSEILSSTRSSSATRSSRGGGWRHEGARRRTWLLRRHRLALRHDLVDLVALRAGARSRQCARDRARRLVLRIVRRRRDPLPESLDARRRRRTHVQPGEREPAEVREVRDALAARARSPPAAIARRTRFALAEQHQHRPRTHRHTPNSEISSSGHCCAVGEHHPEHRRRCADEQPVRTNSMCAHRAAEPAPQIVERERARPHRRLEARPEREQRVHVQREVPDPVVHEHVRQRAPQRALQASRLEPQHRERIRVAHHRPLQEEHRDVDREQRLHGPRQPRSVVRSRVGLDSPSGRTAEVRRVGRSAPRWSPSPVNVLTGSRVAGSGRSSPRRRRRHVTACRSAQEVAASSRTSPCTLVARSSQQPSSADRCSCSSDCRMHHDRRVRARPVRLLDDPQKLRVTRRRFAA